MAWTHGKCFGFALGAVLAAGTVNACSSSGDGEQGGSGSENGSATGSDGQTASGIACASESDCNAIWPLCDTGSGQCVECLSDADCSGAGCDSGTQTCGGDAPPGAPGSGPGPGSGSGPGGGTAPQFPGAGAGGAGLPLQPGFGPETADDCPPVDGVGSSSSTVVRPSATLCFYGDDPDVPAATIEQVIEVVDGVEYIHLRVTFDPRFVDNTYGENSIGWSPNRGHTFRDLVKSDHVELLLTDCAGDTVMQFKVDYIDEDTSAPSGFGSLGVTGGDGEMIVGDPGAVLAVATSLDRNLNGCGYSTYISTDLKAIPGDSPATDENYTPNPETPDWDYRMQYEVWLDASAFEQCFGQAYIEYVHASPAKSSSDTIQVTGGPCPPDWDVPYCPPGTTGEGSNCGTPTDAGTPPPGCPPNYTAYDGDPSCPGTCVPIPFAGYENRAACPAGYVLDLASEGQYCVPESGNVCPE